MSLLAPLAKVRGLGSAKRGVEHWWAQRVTAVALVPLGMWMMIGMLRLAGAGRFDVANWLSVPTNALGLSLLLVTLFYHFYLGIKVVLEDYVHNHARLVVAIILMKLACSLLAAMGLLAVLRLHMVGAAPMGM